MTFTDLLAKNAFFVSLVLMKRALFFLVILPCVFFLSFLITQSFGLKGLKWMKKEEERFSAAPFPLKHKPFTILVVAHNNGAFVEKTLSSIFSQCYDNFRLIYIDDASNDGSFELARDRIYESDHLAHVTLVKNEERLGLLANIYRAALSCPDDEILVPLDAEDWLAHEWVLEKLNAYYDDPSLWLCLAQGMHYPTYKCAPRPDFTEARFQKQNEAHLKSFYAALFKKIEEKDLVRQGSFLPSCAELAYLSPMLEMAKEHAFFTKDVLCIHNAQKTKQEDQALVEQCESFIRDTKPYSSLTSLQVFECGELF